MNVAKSRNCRDCGIQLDRQNPGDLCVTCARSDERASCVHPEGRIYTEAGGIYCGHCNSRLEWHWPGRYERA